MIESGIVVSTTTPDSINAVNFAYYHHSRPHLSLERNSPVQREAEPHSRSKVISIPQVGALHHRYVRAA